FVKGSLMDTKDVVMQVGAKASVMKSVPDARAVVEKQIEEMQSFLVELQKGMQQFSVRMAELQTEIQGAMQQEQQAEKSKK
ncbi:MAG: hypothetical protein Q7R96_03270, partial [Nanoarchaeota archaeon]|nr:hypothetical protein [Nanoarchaeota archaeon]